MTRVVHFDIPIDDPPRATAFYRDALGWQIEKWGPVDYWMLRAPGAPGPGVEGAMTPRKEAPEGVLVYFGIDEIDVALADVTAAGGTVVTEKASIPAVGWSALVRDTEGNLIGLFQPDPQAPSPGS